jgi:N-carbamoyl-L-amino-acid hydrolase
VYARCTMSHMSRRQFAAAALGSLAVRLNGPALAAADPPHVNGDRLNARLTALSEFGRNPQGGVSRVAYSQADVDARAAVITWMRAASLEATIDVAANIVGRRPGRDATLPPIVFGSHIDSVPEGGNYDGNVGSMAAIEVAQVLAELGTTTRHPLEVVIWSNEEGALSGSRAWSGQLDPAELSHVSVSGLTIADGIRALGGDPARLSEARRSRGDIAAYFELHIEQGGVLDAAHVDIGVVEGIVGIGEWSVTVTGFANHAGTTPMDQRHDALLAAARFVEMVNRVVTSEPGRQVGTVGKIQAWPGAPNVVPGKVTCSLELRDLDDAKVQSLFERIRSEAATIASQNGTTIEIALLSVDQAATSDPRLRAIVAETASGLGLSTRAMPSGAGHDAQAIATLGPMAMIFVPSAGGISHSPKEFTKPTDVVNGANVLLGAVLAADRVL